VIFGLHEAHTPGVPMWVHETIGQLRRFAVQQGLGVTNFTS
jgi:hypothetical protein